MGIELEYNDGQTPLDEEEKEGLKIRTISSREELDQFEQQNIEEALQWTMNKKFKLDQVLSEQFITNLHKRMYGGVWKWAGTFRRSDKNIGVTWTQIPMALRGLIDDTKYWIENKTFSEDEIAIRFKHRLVSIHCFPNGNGRHSRMMADLIAQHIFKKPVFTWGSTNLVKAGDVRNKYLAAIRQADRDNIDPLLQFSRS